MLIFVAYEGDFYSVGDTEWDRETFRILTWIFQASVGEVESPGLPITISK